MYKNNGKNEKKCEVCEEKFFTSLPWQKYCSQKCKRIKYNKKYHTDDYHIEHFEYYKLRFEILKRDNFRCQYCGMTPQDGIKLNIDHVYPKKMGGKLTMDNLITSCEICNQGKKDIVLDEHIHKKMKHIIEKNGKHV